MGMGRGARATGAGAGRVGGEGSRMISLGVRRGRATAHGRVLVGHTGHELGEALERRLVRVGVRVRVRVRVGVRVRVRVRVRVSESSCTRSYPY